MAPGSAKRSKQDVARDDVTPSNRIIAKTIAKQRVDRVRWKVIAFDLGISVSKAKSLLDELNGRGAFYCPSCGTHYRLTIAQQK